MKFYLRVRGRRIGALGLAQNFQVSVEALDYESARLRLYEKFEHISSVEQIVPHCEMVSLEDFK